MKDHVQEKVPCSFGFFETVYLLVNLSTRGWAVISLPQGWIRRWVLRLPHIRVQLPPASISTNSVSKEVTSKAKTQMQSFCEHKPLNYTPGVILTVSPRSPLGPCNPYLVEEE